MELDDLEHEITHRRATALPPLQAAREKLNTQIAAVEEAINGLEERTKEAALQAGLGAPTTSLQTLAVELSAAREQLSFLQMAREQVSLKLNQETTELNRLIAARDSVHRVATVRTLADTKITFAQRITDTVGILRALMDEYDAVGAQIEKVILNPDPKMREKLGHLRGRGRVLSFIEHVVEGYQSPWPPFIEWEREAAHPFVSYSE